MTTNSSQQSQPQTGPIAQQLVRLQTNGHQPRSPRDQEQVDRLRKKLNGRKKAANKWRSGWAWLQFIRKVVTALALPIVLLFFTLSFNAQQNAQQAQQNAQQATANSAQALNQQQETTFQAYLDRMSDLIENGKLADPHSSPAIRALAQSQTFAALRRSDAKRKGYIIQFLHDALLLAQPKPIINLNLIGAILHGADLTNAHLNGTDLSSADLINAHLNGADLTNATLTAANLTNTTLTAATLSSADLTNATLSNATLSNAHLNSAILRNANLNAALLDHADLTVAHLTATTLSNANLSYATLIYADLSSADLRGATLIYADLSYAHLKGARNLFQPQLDHVHSCTKVILPTGLKCPGDQ